MVKIWNDLTGDIVDKREDAVSNHVLSKNVYCERNNAETKVAKNVRKKQKEYMEAYNQTKTKIKELHEEGLEINVKNILTKLEIEIWTNGDRVRDILGIMVCSGLLKKHKVNYTKKNGEKGFKYVFLVNPRNNVKICPYLKEGKCTFIWARGRQEDR